MWRRAADAIEKNEINVPFFGINPSKDFSTWAEANARNPMQPSDPLDTMKRVDAVVVSSRLLDK